MDSIKELKENMVQGIDLVLVDVAFLTFNPNRDIHKPIVKLDSTCTAGVFELKKHKELKRKQKYEMGLDAYRHYKWYNSCLKMECQKSDSGDSNTKLKILHWHIESGNIEAFKMQGVTYKAVSIIISPSVEYWYCANQGPNALHTFGSRLRGITCNGNNDSISFEPLVERNICSRDDSCMKNNCNECMKELKIQRTAKSPKTINNRIEKENSSRNIEESSVLKAIELLNQKKSILKNGVNGIPKVQNCNKRGLKPILEEHNY